ncbi:hypothetical protein BSLG_005785 [Batrachochytrium salamandrivorans]|nr:hypothetical protein BSLG_005785 [Batrachochytrium salamandrivorans]
MMEVDGEDGMEITMDDESSEEDDGIEIIMDNEVDSDVDQPSTRNTIPDEFKPSSNKASSSQDDADTTLFIRNLSFEKQKRALQRNTSDCLVEYEKAKSVALLVMDPTSSNAVPVLPTSRNEYTTVNTSNSHKSVITPELSQMASGTNPAFMLGGRMLSITIAVSKKLAGELTYDSKLRRRAQDKRNIDCFWKQVEEGTRQPLEPEVVDEELQQGNDAPGIKRKVTIRQAKVLLDMDRLDAVTKNQSL